VPGLHETAAALTLPGKGILAADESIATMSKRLEGAGVTATAVARRDYREVLLTTPGLSAWVSGIILCDETLRQSTSDGTPVGETCLARGVTPGIKVDTGVTPLPFASGNTVTEGLDGLRGRLQTYRELGAKFAKWRAVLDPTGLSRRALYADAHALARYAGLCQEAGIVPIVEPELLMEGSHSAALCEAFTANALSVIFDELHRLGIDQAGMILKPNMVLAGTAAEPSTPDEVAARTLRVLRDEVPRAVPGIAFLSGGQSNERACANLAAINHEAVATGGAPWRLTYSFGRALVDDALRAWHGVPANVEDAQAALAANCARAGAASDPFRGKPTLPVPAPSREEACRARGA
jgi:fructose-bisphosphate aldolase class I